MARHKPWSWKKIFSWTAGISMGSSVFFVLAALVALAVFVRTDYFQNGLRDRLIEGAKRQLEAEIVYEKAEVSLFRFHPRIDFYNVVLDHQETKVLAEIDRVSLSISFFISLPLLLFKEIYISEAEVEGLQYELSDIAVIQAWSNRLKPREGSLPTSYRAFVNKIQFSDFELGVDLEKGDILGKDLKAVIQLKQFNVTFDGNEVIYGGELALRDLEYENINIPDGKVVVDEAIHSGDTTKFRKARIESGEDFLEISGEVKRWKDPIIDLDADFVVDTVKYLKDFALQGQMKGEVSVRGPWKALEGEGRTELKGFSYKGKSFDLISSEWVLREPILKLKQLNWQSGAERVSATGQVDFSAAGATNLNVKFEDVQIGEYVGLLERQLSKWGGRLQGEANVKGQIFQDRNFEIETKFKMTDYQVRSYPDEIMIFWLPQGDVEASLKIDKEGHGEFTASLKTEMSNWGGGGRWDDSSMTFRWDSVWSGGHIGRLYFFEVNGKGSLSGEYSGPFSSMVMKVQPRFETFSLNDQTFTNLEGELVLKKRRLFGDAITSDQGGLTGGLYFPRDRPTEFSEFDFDFKDLNLSSFLDVTSVTREYSPYVSATMGGQGHLEGRIRRPSGEGRVELKDLRLTSDDTQGRRADLNWDLGEGKWHLRDIRSFNSKEAEPMKGEALIDSKGIRSLNLNGKGLNLRDWAIASGVDVQMQSLMNLDLNFDRDALEMKSEVYLYDTLISGAPREPSSLQLAWSKAEFSLRSQFFNQALVLNASGKRKGSKKKIEGNIRINNLNLVPFLQVLQNSGLSLSVKGNGDFEYTQNVPKPSYLDWLKSDGHWKGNIAIQESIVERASNELHRIEAFQIKFDSKGGKDFRVKTDRLLIHTGKEKLLISGHFRNLSDLRVRLDGATNLASVSYFLEFLSRSEGKLELEGYVDPKGFTGSLFLSDGEVAFAESPLLVRNVRANILSTNSNMLIRQFSGDFQEGSVVASGRLTLKWGRVLRSLITVQLENTMIEPREGVRFRASGPLTLRISEKGEELTGDLSIYDGSFRRRTNLRSDILNVFKRDRKKYSFYVEDTDSVFDGWKLNIGLRTSEPVDIRNNIADGQVDFQLRVLGTIGKPKLSGRIILLRGRFSYNNRSFDLRSGAIQFSNPDSNTPNYDIRAEAEVDAYRVFVSFQGGANEQKITYSSDPPLTEKEILALVSYGAPPTDDSEELEEDVDNRSTSAAFTGISLFTGRLQDSIEGTLASDLGIKRFQVYPAFFDYTGRTELQLTVGTDIVRNRLSINYSNFLSASGGHKVELDLRVNRNISLVGSWRDVQDENEENIGGDFGGDILFRFEFE